MARFFVAITLLCVWFGSCIGDPMVESGGDSENVAQDIGNTDRSALLLELVEKVASHDKLVEKFELQELLIQNLQERVDNLEAMDTVQHDENVSLRKRVEYLERRDKQRLRDIGKYTRMWQRKVDTRVGLISQRIDHNSDTTKVKVQDKETRFDDAPNDGHTNGAKKSMISKTWKDAAKVLDKETRFGGAPNNGHAYEVKESTTPDHSTGHIQGNPNVDTMERGKRQSYEASHVAFFAQLDTSIYDFGPDQIVVFKNVITNIGDAYNANVGHFEATVDGTYVFSYKLKAFTAALSYFYLSVNGNNVSPIALHGELDLYYVSSEMLVIELAQGDNVTIRSDNSGYDLRGGKYSSFSGFLLRPRLNNEIVG